MTFNLQRLFRKNKYEDSEFTVKINRSLIVQGVRVSLGEIESILNQQPDILQNHVKVFDPETDHPRIVAYIIPAGNVENARQLHQRLRHVLPMHLMPEQFVLLEEFPLLPSGEVDEARLPVPPPEPPAEETAAQSRGERFLLKLWKEILNVPAVNVEDDFFQRGGDTSRAEAMLTRIENSTGVKLSLEQLQTHSTLRSLAELLDQARPVSSSETTIELRPGEGRPIFLIPAAARTSLSAIRYVSRIRDGVRVVGVEYPSILPAMPAPKRVPALAEHFISQIRLVQPQGPYSLAGNCMGGTLVYEIIQQLSDAGQPVDRVMMIDCGAPTLKGNSKEKNLGYYLGRISFMLQNGSLFKRVRSRVLRLMRPVRRLNVRTDIRHAIKYLWDAKNAYRASGRYKGSMLVVLNSLSRESQRASDWENAAPNSEIHYIEEADHVELFNSERGLDTIGELMNRYLDGK